MIGKAKLECDEAHRALLCSFNGLAAIHLITKNVNTAIETYKEALELIEKNANIATTDVLQKLHIAHNYHQVLSDMLEEDNTPQLKKEMEQMKSTADSIRKDILKKTKTKVDVSMYNFESVHTQVKQLQKELRLDKNPWYEALLKELAAHSTESKIFMDKLLQELTGVHNAVSAKNVTTIANKFRNISGTLIYKERASLFVGLRLVIHQELEKLSEARAVAVEALETLSVNPSADGIQSVRIILTATEIVATVNCSKCHKERIGPVCAYCKVEDSIKKYEQRLYTIYKKKLNQNAMPEEEFDDTSTTEAETEDRANGIHVIFCTYSYSHSI